MGKIISLREMEPGQRARIKEITATGSIRRRLLDIGLAEALYRGNGSGLRCRGCSTCADGHG